MRHEVTTYKSLFFQNTFCAICFVLDYRAGLFAASILLVAALLYSFIRAAVRHRNLKAAMRRSYLYLIWIAAIVVSGVVSSALAERKTNEIVDAATAFRMHEGRYPESLSELPEFASAIDEKSFLHIGMSRIFLHKGTVTFQKFPGKWVSLNLESKVRSELDVL